MIKTIIADNEVWVCHLIKEMVDWESLGFSVEALAYDGDQLLSQIEEHRPDLIITDIRMPCKTGLEVVQEIKERGLETGVIIISGYSDFEYAKKAIDLGVFSYLLKPFEKETLTSALLGFKASIANSIKQKEEFSHLQEKLYTSMSSHFDMYIKGLIKRESAVLPISTINSQFNRKFSSGFFRTIVISVDSHLRDIDMRPRIFKNILSTFEGAFHPFCSESFSFEQPPFLILAINYPSDSDKLMRTIFDDLLYECVTSIPYVSSHSVTIGVGKPVNDISLIADSYDSAMDAIHSRTTLGLKRLIYGDQLPCSHISLSKESKNKISTYINSYFSDISAEKLISELLEQFSEHGTPYALFDATKLIYESAMFSVTKPVVDRYRSFYSSSYDQLRMESAQNIDGLKSFLCTFITTLKDQNSTSSENKSVIDVVKSYINEHLDQDLSLNELAELIHFNPNYLCELFKKETGENFSKYITYKRVEAAKAYLEDLTLKCSDIAMKVGYSDVNYFNRIFKSYLGLTPKQYRKMFIER